jgi:hypothetical protein
MDLIVEWLTAWYNLPYLFALAVAMSFSSFQVLFGFLPDAVDVDVDGDVDADVDTDTDVHDVSGKATFAGNAMSFMGFGKAPAAVLGLTFLFFFGSMGLIINAALKGLVVLPVLSIVVVFVSMTGNLLVSGFITGRVAAVLNLWLPGHDTVTAAGKDSLHTEGVTTTVICEKGGTVQLGKARWVDAITAPGTSDIPKGSQVLLVAYDKAHTRYTAEPIT